MKQIFIFKKTGFYAYKPFEIFDEKNKLFYSDLFTNKIKNGKTLYFNLPKGVYKLVGNIFKLKFPVKNKKIILPARERNYPKKRLKIIFGNNPNKSTIFWRKNLILFDNAFLDVPKYMLFDVYFHELGHRYYKTEHLADLYATKRMLKAGFNKSQIGLSVITTLGDNSYYRKVLKIGSLKSP